MGHPVICGWLDLSYPPFLDSAELKDVSVSRSRIDIGRFAQAIPALS
jgi:hypothetical protein